MDGEEEKYAQTANGHRGMLPHASQREVPLDCDARLWAMPRPSRAVLIIHGALTAARHRSDHNDRGIARDLVTLLEGTQARMG